MKTRAEQILDKYYPTQRTVFRDAILRAMHEFADQLQKPIKQSSQKPAEQSSEKLGVYIQFPKNLHVWENPSSEDWEEKFMEFELQNVGWIEPFQWGKLQGLKFYLWYEDKNMYVWHFTTNTLVFRNFCKPSKS